MRRKQTVSRVSLVLLVLASACLPLAAGAGCGAVINDYTVGSGPIKVAVGDQFDINLKADQGAGFRWVLEQTDKQTLHLQSSDYIPPGKAQEIPGMGDSGAQTWRFKGTSKGSAALEFDYLSPARGDEQPAVVQEQKFTINVI